MFEILAIIALIIFIIVAKRSLVWGLSLIVLLLPSYLWRLSFWGLPTTFLELMILAIFILWLFKDKLWRKINWRLDSRSFNPLPKVWRYLLLFWLLASLIALAVNPTWPAMGLWRAYFLEPLLFFLVFIYTVKNKQDKQCIIYALGGLVLWLGVVSIWQNFTDWNLPAAYNFPNSKRLTAIFSYPNAISLLIAPITAWFAGLWLSGRKKTKGSWYLGIGLIGISLLILAKSEGAILALLLALLIYFLNCHLTKMIKKLVSLEKF